MDRNGTRPPSDSNEHLYGWPEDWWVDYRGKIQAVTVAEVQRVAKKVLELDQMIVLAVGSASEIEAGDPDHPGTFAEIAKLPIARLPLRGFPRREKAGHAALAEGRHA